MMWSLQGWSSRSGRAEPAGEAERAHRKRTGTAETCPSDRQKFLQIAYNFRFLILPQILP
jgi:hypothetical protein